MIQGGTSAAGRAARTGYTQYYIPCLLFASSKSVLEKMQNTKRVSVYNAYVKIEDFDGGLQLLNSCSYFQIQKYAGAGIDNATLTIQRAEIWGIWQDTYKNLLKPSKRSVTIFAGIPGKEEQVFCGRITGYQESQGSGGGAINLNLSDHRLTVQRTTTTQKYTEHTRFYEISRIADEIFKNAGQVLQIADTDTVSTWTPTGNGLESANQALSGEPEWTGGALVTINSGNVLTVTSDDLLIINDSLISNASRNFHDSSAFNTVNVKGLVDDVLTTDIVQDETDAKDRGIITYSAIVGSEHDNIEQAKLQAQRLIARALSGVFRCNTVYLPYLEPGQIVKIQSNRFNIALSTAKITSVMQQYQVGNCSTSISGLELLE